MASRWGAPLRADCYRLYDGVRHYRHDQLAHGEVYMIGSYVSFYDHRRANDGIDTS